MSAVPAWLRSPRTLLVVLLVVMLSTVVFAASTSTAAFGAYNAAWDGSSQLQEQASAVDTQSQIALNTSVYETTTPDGTVAVILTPDRAYTPQEVARVRAFVNDGGTLVVAEDFGQYSNPLLDALGVDTSVDGRLLRDERYYYQSPNITVATDVERSQLTTGVDQLTLNHGTALVANTTEESETEILVNSSSFAYFDENRNAAFDENETIGQRPVATAEPVGEGRVIVIADPSMMINAMLERPGNQQFVRNIFADHDRVVLDYSHNEALPPLSHAIILIRDSGPLQAILGLVGVAAVAVVSRHRGLARVFRDTSNQEDADADPAEIEDLVAYLRHEHPEWDEDRLERVARSRRQNGRSED